MVQDDHNDPSTSILEKVSHFGLFFDGHLQCSWGYILTRRESSLSYLSFSQNLIQFKQHQTAKWPTPNSTQQTLHPTRCPWRVDSPPMSTICAPAATISLAAWTSKAAVLEVGLKTKGKNIGNKVIQTIPRLVDGFKRCHNSIS